MHRQSRYCSQPLCNIQINSITTCIGHTSQALRICAGPLPWRQGSAEATAFVAAALKAATKGTNTSKLNIYEVIFKAGVTVEVEI